MLEDRPGALDVYLPTIDELREMSVGLLGIGPADEEWSAVVNWLVEDTDAVLKESYELPAAGRNRRGGGMASRKWWCGELSMQKRPLAGALRRVRVRV